MVDIPLSRIPDLLAGKSADMVGGKRPGVSPGDLPYLDSNGLLSQSVLGSGAADGYVLTVDPVTHLLAWKPPSGGATFEIPSIVLGSAAALGASGKAINSDSTIQAFDGTVPVTQAYGDAAATGSAAYAARRDHRHGMPVAPPTMCRARAQGQTDLVNATWTVLNVNGGTWYNTGCTVNTTNITVLTAGYYLLQAYVNFPSNATAMRLCELRCGGIAICVDSRMAVNGTNTHMAISTVYYVTAGQLIELAGYQNSGGTLTAVYDWLAVTQLV